MTRQLTKLERRLRMSSVLVFAGLLVELVSLLWSHPTAFIIFVLLGVTLIVAGILFYLYSLVATSDGPAPTQQ